MLLFEIRVSRRCAVACSMPAQLPAEVCLLRLPPCRPESRGNLLALSVRRSADEVLLIGFRSTPHWQDASAGGSRPEAPLQDSRVNVQGLGVELVRRDPQTGGLGIWPLLCLHACMHSYMNTHLLCAATHMLCIMHAKLKPACDDPPQNIQLANNLPLCLCLLLLCMCRQVGRPPRPARLQRPLGGLAPRAAGTCGRLSQARLACPTPQNKHASNSCC